MDKPCDQILENVPIVRHVPISEQRAGLKKMAPLFFSEPIWLEDL